MHASVINGIYINKKWSVNPKKQATENWDGQT